MSRKKSTSTSADTPDPPPTSEEEVLTSQIRELDKEIAKAQAMIREVPALIIGTGVDAALERVRKRTAEQAVPLLQAAEQPTVHPAGALAVETATGETVRILGASTRVMSPAVEGRVVFTRAGEVKFVPLTELSEAAALTPQTAVGATSLEAGPPPQTTPSAPNPTTTGLRVGDRVETPFGTGTILEEIPGPLQSYKVDVEGKSQYFVGPAEIRLAKGGA